jgi:hypothetical protein
MRKNQRNEKLKEAIPTQVRADQKQEENMEYFNYCVAW